MKKSIIERTLENVKDGAENIFEKSSDLATDARITGESLAEKATDIKDELLGKLENYINNRKEDIRDKKEEIVDFRNKKTEEIKDSYKGFKKNNVEEKNNTGKVILGAAAAAAAAAAAYYIYKKNVEHDETVKAEFSEKMKKWNDCDDCHLDLVMSQVKMPMKIKPSRVYKINTNGKLSDDIIINISEEGKNITFNPEEKIQVVNPLGNLKERADEIAKAAGQKAKDVSQMVSEKAEKIKETAEFNAELAKETISEKIENMKSRSEMKDVLDEKNDEFKDLEYKVENVRADIKNDIEEIKEDHMDKDPHDPISELEDSLVEAGPTETENVKIEINNNPEANNVVTEEIESGIIRKGEDVVLKGKDTLIKASEVLSNIKKTLAEKISSLKKDPIEEARIKEDEFNKNAITKVFDVVIHNKGNKDFYFSPVLIQRYCSADRVTTPTPRHEDGTELEKRVIKPGETYHGKLAIKLDHCDDAIIVYEDLTLRNSIAFILGNELDEKYIDSDQEDMELLNDIFAEDSVSNMAKEIESEVR